MAGENDAIHRNLLTRSHDQFIAHTHLLNRNLPLLAVAQDMGSTRLQANQLLNGLAGLPLCPRFQVLAQENQGNNQSSRIIEGRRADHVGQESGNHTHQVSSG